MMGKTGSHKGSLRVLVPGGRGQSFVELAILFPLLIMVVAGLVEFGFMLNQYLALIDAARNSARFSSDSFFSVREPGNNTCSGAGASHDFYVQTACSVLQELQQEQPTMTIDVGRGDDIVVSAFTVAEGTPPVVSARHPAADGWSYAQALTGTRNQASHISNAAVAARLQSGAPSTGLVMVEIYYHYDLLMELPWITAFIDGPLLLHAYTFMPLVSAEPTPTPAP